MKINQLKRLIKEEIKKIQIKEQGKGYEYSFGDYSCNTGQLTNSVLCQGAAGFPMNSSPGVPDPWMEDPFNGDPVAFQNQCCINITASGPADLTMAPGAPITGGGSNGPSTITAPPKAATPRKKPAVGRNPKAKKARRFQRR